jgi:hypothetical protein
VGGTGGERGRDERQNERPAAEASHACLWPTPASMATEGGRNDSRWAGSQRTATMWTMTRRDPSRWPVRRVRLHDAPSDDLSAVTTVAERMAMMWPLALEAWRIAGRPLPSYGRAEVPGRWVRPGERTDDDASA